MGWLRQLLARGRRYDDLSVSIHEHLEEKIDELMEGGMPREEATAMARREFGNVTAIEETSRETWQWPRVESILADVKYALRQLRKSPGFATTVILTMALGIGANTAIFTLMHAILMRSLPVGDPQSLYRIGDKPEGGLVNGLQNENGDFDVFSYKLYRHLRESRPELGQLAALQVAANPMSVRRGRQASERVQSEFVSGNYFQTLGVGAYAGRVFTDDDDKLGAAPVAVMSYAAWQAEYAGDGSVVGSTFNMQAQAVTVVGVAPASFFGDRVSSNPPAFWMPLATEEVLRQSNSRLRHPDWCWLYLVGRAAPGQALGTLQQELSADVRQWLLTEPAYTRYGIPSLASKIHVVLTPGGGGIQDLQVRTEKQLYLLLAISAFVLLVGCANVANLLLARSSSRRSEISMRLALGAGRGRLIRQMLTESVLLGCMGGIAGVAVGYAGTRALLALVFPGSPAGAIPATPSAAVLGFAFLLSLITGVAFGIAPAFLLSHSDPAEALKGGSRTTGNRTTLAQRGLIVVQAALSLVLLAGAGLLIRSLNNLEHQNFGYETTNRYALHLDPQGAGYAPDKLDALDNDIELRLAAIPGVESVGLALFTPLDGHPWNFQLLVEGRPATLPNPPRVYINRVSPNYFQAVGQPVVRGRGFTRHDAGASAPVALVNQSFAKTYFPGKDPIGHRFGNYGEEDMEACEIVGVVADAKYVNPRAVSEPMFFRPIAQWQSTLTDSTNVGIERLTHYIRSIVIRVRGTPRNLEADARRALSEINPDLTVIDMNSLEIQVAGNFSQERLIARLTALFGLLTLLLAAIGLYGTTSYQVSQRAAEIGLRMAFGANRGRVVGMVMRGAMMQVGLGLVVGIPLVLVAARYVASQLYEVKSYDPVSLLAASGVLAGTAVVAGWLPARRAASMDPMRALRRE